MSDPTPPVPYVYEEPSSVEVFLAPPPPRRARLWLHILLLVLTLFTTLVVGARLEYNFLHNLPSFSLQDDTLPMFPLSWILRSPSNILLGLPFAGALMAILLSHEMGHYVYCMRYGVNATLPYFIPAPTLIGTLGAFIRIKSPIRSRDALFDIGIAGPIAGFVVATLVLIWSLWLSKPMPVNAAVSDVQFGMPLIFHVVYGAVGFFRGPGTWQVPLSRVYLHPTGVAAWVGMFATALNLLPGGQLDGGHIVYAVWPRAHRHVGNLVIGILLPLGFVAIFREKGWIDPSWAGWAGWLVWVIFIGVSGLRHPIVPQYPGVDRRRRWLALVALAMFILTFVPEPFRIQI
jgi:membrane-associated protease RseP (regulator of RpoE activity)